MSYFDYLISYIYALSLFKITINPEKEFNLISYINYNLKLILTYPFREFI